MDIRYERQLKRGLLEIIVLNLLSEKETYGYQLLQELDEKSDGVFKIKEGTMYPILYRLEDDGLIASCWSLPRDKNVSKKFYVITDKGREILKELLMLWSRMDQCANKFLRKAESADE